MFKQFLNDFFDSGFKSDFSLSGLRRFQCFKRLNKNVGISDLGGDFSVDMLTKDIWFLDCREILNFPHVVFGLSFVVLFFGWLLFRNDVL